MTKKASDYNATPVRFKALKAVLAEIAHDKDWSLSKLVVWMCNDHKLTKEYIKLIERRKTPFLKK